MKNKVYYSAQQILSYKVLFNLICGIRGHGKTYETTKRAVKDALKNKQLTIAIFTRYKEDIDIIKHTWIEGCEPDKHFPDYRFRTEKRYVIAKNIKTEEEFAIAEFIPINEYIKQKRVPRRFVKWILFDEFLLEDGRYIKNEVDKFLSLCDSIIRNRNDVRVMLCSNHASTLNPYFDYFGFRYLNKRFTKGKHNSILEFTDSEAFKKFRENTQFGKSIKGTRYGQFAMEGRFMLDDMTNVNSKPQGKKQLLFSLVLNGKGINVYFMNNLMFFGINKDFSKKSYTPYLDDAKKYNAYFCEKSLKYFQHIVHCFKNDEVLFETLSIKNEIIELVRFLIGARYEKR